MTSSPPHPTPQGAPAALINGLAVLEAFGQAKDTLGVTEIAEHVGLHKSTISRVLHGLAEAGYVSRNLGTGRYQLGLRVLSIAAPLLANLDPRIASLPYLEVLSSQTLETSALTLWNGKNAIVVEQVASPHQVKHTASIGTQYNKWASSTIRGILAYLDRDALAPLVSNKDLIVDENWSEAVAQAELDLIQSQGYALNDGQTTPEEFGIAAPVFDPQNKIIGSIVLSAPRSRVQHQNNQNFLIQCVIDAARATTLRLGGTN